eukprot:GFUD01067117.1.p1 GENE.GFUD01067117.1~~GFUD01067117.1.p1  ORF type:complete len:134 (-),score=47.77 GFUD01067117.1:154-555(-)
MFRHLLRAVNCARHSLVGFNSDGVKNIPTYHPDSLDKKILVHFKYFASVEEIPHRVSESMMIQAKSKARIKTANLMIFSTIVCACITIYFAKTSMKQNSLVEENQRRHTMYKKGETGSGARMGLVTNTKDDSC